MTEPLDEMEPVDTEALETDAFPTGQVPPDWDADAHTDRYRTDPEVDTNEGADR